MIRVGSTDGVEVAVYDLGGASTAPPLLISHATGFHAHCYTPMTTMLAADYHVSALDYRGHGLTDVDQSWDVDWARFGDDALAVARHVAPDGGLVAFGHSMGGAALLMAAARDPGLFERLVLFEPIAHQPTDHPPSRDEVVAQPIVQSAVRRRRSFPSYEAAIENYRSKPPLNGMVPEALRHYVEFGFRPTTATDGTPAVELRCTPEIESGIFISARDNQVWDMLPEIETPCLVLGGHVQEREPSSFTEPIADRLPRGQYVLLDHQTHFGPFSHPDEIVALITG